MPSRLTITFRCPVLVGPLVPSILYFPRPGTSVGQVVTPVDPVRFRVEAVHRTYPPVRLVPVDFPLTD